MPGILSSQKWGCGCVMQISECVQVLTVLCNYLIQPDLALEPYCASLHSPATVRARSMNPR